MDIVLGFEKLDTSCFESNVSGDVNFESILQKSGLLRNNLL